jgi:hypothetical protein
VYAIPPLTTGAVPSIRIDGSRRVPVTGLEAYIASLLTDHEAA